jgi:3-oxoacyl-[acyl-carrier protein] reductase
MTTSPLRMVLTGCASGIGRHLAAALSARGHRILATDIDDKALAAEAARRGFPPDRVLVRKLDVRSEADWDAALDAATAAFGGVDVVFNIAGALRPGYVHELAAKDIDLHLDVNVKGVVLGTRAAARRMMPVGKGHIINFGSLASLVPVPGLSLYSASKFAVRGFSLAAANELSSHGISVTVILPDAVATPMLDLQVDYAEAAMTFSGARPLTVEEIERIIVDQVLPERPLEIVIPRSRGALARLANVAPAISQRLAPLFLKRGLQRQAEIKRGGGGGS